MDTSDHRLYHYESLLIQTTNFIKEKKNRKISVSTFFTIASILLTIFGFSKDSIGYGVIDKIWTSSSIIFPREYVLLFPSASLTIILLINTLVMLFKFKISNIKIVLDSIREPFGQERILRGFLLSKYLKDNNIIIKNDNDITKYVIKRDYQIYFIKHDLMMYIGDHLIPIIGREYISNMMEYLSELILINGYKNKLIFKSLSNSETFTSVIKKDLFVNMYFNSKKPLRIRKLF